MLEVPKEVINLPGPAGLFANTLKQTKQVQKHLDTII